MNECNETFETVGVATPNRLKLSNHRYCPNEKKQDEVPVDELRKQIIEETGYSLFTVNGTLHAVNKSHNVRVFSGRADFFAWLYVFYSVDWKAKFHEKNEFFEYCKKESPQFQSLSYFPHFPPIENVRYLCEIPEPIQGPETPQLDAFVSFFSPATEMDRTIIILMLLTFCWGGPPGQRPSFVITGEPDSVGVGTGKSKILDVNSDFVGGQISTSLRESGEALKTRILTPSNKNRSARVVSIDNAKTRKLSMQDFESLVTASHISGRVLYSGDGSIPNYFTYVITINDPNLSRDLASRSVVLQLTAPLMCPDWLYNVENFIKQNRTQLLAEINYLLTVKQPESFTAGGGTRYALWEKEVLSKLPNSNQLRDLIVQRQKQYDDDKHQRMEFAEFLDEVRMSHSLQMVLESIIVIPVEKMILIYREFCNDNVARNTIASKIASLGLPSIRYANRQGKTKYFLFNRKGEPINEGIAKKALKAFEKGQYSA